MAGLVCSAIENSKLHRMTRLQSLKQVQCGLLNIYIYIYIGMVREITKEMSWIAPHCLLL